MSHVDFWRGAQAGDPSPQLPLRLSNQLCLASMLSETFLRNLRKRCSHLMIMKCIMRAPRKFLGQDLQFGVEAVIRDGSSRLPLGIQDADAD